MTRIPGGKLSLEQELDLHWRRWTLLAWVVVAIFYLWQRQAQIAWLVLSDTDDNMRLMQVRGLLSGQGWFDLTQYRLNPPYGFNIHWSRIVDLPIAGLILLLRPFVGNAVAESWASGVAPLLPLGVAMLALAGAVRRLVAPIAWPLALIVLLGCGSTMLMFMPMRIDHHGWQLAMLAVTVMGMVDPRRARGGAIVGLSSAVSLNIGLEMLPYCAAAGAIITLEWIWDRDAARRLAAYALTLGGGSALGFAIFASDANHAMRCDALTPVWLSVMVVAGALLLLIVRIGPDQRWQRLALAAVAGAIIGVAFATVFPQCLGRPEGVSPELERVWLNNVREAKPIYKHPFRSAFPIAVLPVIGVLGALAAAWRARGTARVTGWLTIALFTLFAAGLLLWQIRAGPAAQLLSVPGATWLIWTIVPWLLRHRNPLLRIGGPVVAFLVASGLFAGMMIRWLPIDRPNPRVQIVNRANARCASETALRVIDRALPSTILFTHVDLGPRLITLTHHDAIAGPYHRNGDAILDVHHAFMGSPANFLAIARRHHATHLLICPNMAETTVYRARSPGGFYAQLAKGKVPNWLEPVDLPRQSPFRLFRIDYPRADAAATPAEATTR